MKKFLIPLAILILSSCASAYVPVSYSPTKVVKKNDMYLITYTSAETKRKYTIKATENDYRDLTFFKDIFDTNTFIMEKAGIIVD